MSTRITTSMVQRSVLRDLNAVNDRLTRSNQKIASGKEITKPSDDPFNASRALHLRENVEATQQYKRTVTDAQGWQEATEQALNNITQDVHTARDLLVQAGTDTIDAAGRQGILVQLNQLISGVKQEANASIGDRYIFGGAKTDTPPYTDGVDDTYKGDAGQLARQVGPGVSMSINVLGSTVLGNGQAAGDDKLLNVLRDIADHLASGDSDSLRGTDLTRLSKNLDDLLGVRADNGAKQNRLEAAGSRLDQIEETTTSTLSQVQDADVAKTLIDFNSQSAAYQAALKAGANIIQPSLMDFLR